MANNAVWQVLHLLCIVAHIGMLFTSVAAWVVNSHEEFDEFRHGNIFRHGNMDVNSPKVVYPWRVIPLVSFSFGN